MPLSAHYGGKGRKVMSSMTAQYGAKKAKKVFYATENAMHNKRNQMEPNNKMPKGGTQSPKGDLGLLRVREAGAAGFTIPGASGKDVSSSELPYRKPQMAKDGALSVAADQVA